MVLVVQVDLFVLGFQGFLLGLLLPWVPGHPVVLLVREFPQGQVDLETLWLRFHLVSLEFLEYQVVPEVPKDLVGHFAQVVQPVLVVLLLL